MTNTIQGSQTLFLGLQAEFKRMDEIVTQHETIILSLRLKVETSSQRVNSVLSSVEEKIKDFEVLINEVRQYTMDTEIPMEILNILHEIIQESAPSVAVEIMRQQVKELSVQSTGFQLSKRFGGGSRRQTGFCITSSYKLFRTM